MSDDNLSNILSWVDTKKNEYFNYYIKLHYVKRGVVIKPFDCEMYKRDCGFYIGYDICYNLIHEILLLPREHEERYLCFMILQRLLILEKRIKKLNICYNRAIGVEDAYSNVYIRIRALYFKLRNV